MAEPRCKQYIYIFCLKWVLTSSLQPMVYSSIILPFVTKIISYFLPLKRSLKILPDISVSQLWRDLSQSSSFGPQHLPRSPFSPGSLVGWASAIYSPKYFISLLFVQKNYTLDGSQESHSIWRNEDRFILVNHFAHSDFLRETVFTRFSLSPGLSLSSVPITPHFLFFGALSDRPEVHTLCSKKRHFPP